MSIEADIRYLLQHEPLTIEQLAEKLSAPYDMINTTTAYEMTDVYEEDDGTLRLLGTKCRGKVREKHYNRVTPEMVAIIEELAGTMSNKKIAEAIEIRTGIRMARQSVYDVIKRNGWKTLESARKWTDEMNEFVFAFYGTIRQKTEALNEMFGTQFTEKAVSDHLKVVRNNEQQHKSIASKESEKR